MSRPGDNILSLLHGILSQINMSVPWHFTEHVLHKTELFSVPRTVICTDSNLYTLHSFLMSLAHWSSVVKKDFQKTIMCDGCYQTVDIKKICVNIWAHTSGHSGELNFFVCGVNLCRELCTVHTQLTWEVVYLLPMYRFITYFRLTFWGVFANHTCGCNSWTQAPLNSIAF